MEKAPGENQQKQSRSVWAGGLSPKGPWGPATAAAAAPGTNASGTGTRRDGESDTNVTASRNAPSYRGWCNLMWVTSVTWHDFQGWDVKITEVNNIARYKLAPSGHKGTAMLFSVSQPSVLLTGCYLTLLPDASWCGAQRKEGLSESMTKPVLPIPAMPFIFVTFWSFFGAPVIFVWGFRCFPFPYPIAHRCRREPGDYLCKRSHRAQEPLLHHRVIALHWKERKEFYLSECC